jgi:hypothetical protein
MKNPVLYAQFFIPLLLERAYLFVHKNPNHDEFHQLYLREMDAENLEDVYLFQVIVLIRSVGENGYYGP